jgi:thiamine transport system ATP-binding protein
MLTVEGLAVAYGDTIALDGVDVTVADGEIVSVLGPSGSGKSTLLRAIAGLTPAARGRVAWDGADVAPLPTHQRGFGLMFQDHALFPHRDVLGNVAFGLQMRGLPRGDVDARARATLALVGLAGFERRRIAELSGGEQQRVALARALAPEPGLLMLDEPLGALDRELRDRLVGELRSLFATIELSVLFVTHDHDEAFALADRIVILHDGRVAQDGNPAEVWHRPADAFVARFLGWNVTDAFENRHGPSTPNGPVALRPDDLLLGADGVAGVVVTRTFRRDHHLLTVRLDVGDDVRVAVEPDDDAPPVGATVRVARKPGIAVHPIGGADGG